MEWEGMMVNGPMSSWSIIDTEESTVTRERFGTHLFLINLKIQKCQEFKIDQFIVIPQESHFIHDTHSWNQRPPPSNDKMCWAFEKGTCNRGDSCKFVHSRNVPSAARNDDWNNKAPPPQQQHRRLFVGNLEFKVTSNDLARFMSQAGCVCFAEVFQEAPGRSRGCGVVEYEDPVWHIYLVIIIIIIIIIIIVVVLLLPLL
jgi:hypothetical protein